MKGINYSLMITIFAVFFVSASTMLNTTFLNKTFLGYSDIKNDLTGNYVVDREIINEAKSTNGTIMLFLAMICAGLTFAIYNSLRFVELKVRKWF